MARRRRRRLTSAQRAGIDRRTRIQARRYARFLEGEIAAAAEEVMPTIIDAVRASPDVRTDAIRGFDDLFTELHQALDTRLSVRRLRQLLQRQSDMIQLLTARELSTMIGVPVDQLPETDGVLEGIWIDRNARMGEDLARQYVDGVERVLREAQPGVRGESLIGELMRRASVTRSAARRLAVDETLSLHGALNQRRQETLGFVQYEWSTSQDSRVRKWHQRLNGSIQRWSSPPLGGGTSESDRGHPGVGGILCRCVAVPQD